MLMPDPRILSRLQDAKVKIESALAMKNITQDDPVFQDHVHWAWKHMQRAEELLLKEEKTCTGK